MSEKLGQMDDLVMRVISALDNDTVLFIMGDHGMNYDGDHGGGSKDETSTVIAAYYQEGFRKYKEPGLDRIMKSFTGNSSQLIQMDMAPTLAMLLGLPIPASNTGHMINDLYINKRGGNGDIETPREFILNLVRDNYINMVQTSNYLKAAQMNFKKFPNETFNEMEKGYDEMKVEYQHLRDYAEKNPEDYEKIREYAVDLIVKMQDMGDKVYDLMKISNSYDFQLTVMGIIGTYCSLFIALLLLQYAHIHIKSAELLNNLNDDLSIKVILDILFKNLTNIKVLAVFGLITGIMLTTFKLDVLKIATIFIIILTLTIIFSLGRHAISQTKLAMQSTRGTFERLRWIFVLDSPFSTVLGLAIVLLGISLRLSVYLTRLESIPLINSLYNNFRLFP